jgi:hypothetical protein
MQPRFSERSFPMFSSFACALLEVRGSRLPTFPLPYRLPWWDSSALYQVKELFVATLEG